MSSRADVVIIGGGIGGLSAAAALAQKGVRVRVYERSSEFGEVGAGLQIAPNCTRILDQLGLLDEAKALGVRPAAMIMRDAADGSELTRLDLRDLEGTYGFPYIVIHRSDLHAIFLRACQRRSVELITSRQCIAFDNTEGVARCTFADGSTDEAEVIIAADGLHSVARQAFIGDEPASSSYVAYRAAVPFSDVRGNDIDDDAVVVYVGPRRHFVQYPLRGGEMFNQVAVFQSPRAVAGEAEWGTPDELDHAFAGSCDAIQQGLAHMWRDRWWRMFDREPTMNWVFGRVVLLGDAAHPPLQYMAQGAIMAIEDGWVLAEHAGSQKAERTMDRSGIDWDSALRAYNAVRPEHCRRVLTTARAWGELWHLDGIERRQRNVLLRARDVHDYAFTDWIYGPTALTPDQEPPMYRPIPLASAGTSLDAHQD